MERHHIGGAQDGRHMGAESLTAERRDGSVERLDKNALVGDLLRKVVSQGSRPRSRQIQVLVLELRVPGERELLTSSSELASSSIHPSSITSAESLVT